jgi:hypothetical protein
VQVKNKPCVVYTVMHLIPWKQSHGSETGILLRDIEHVYKWFQLMDQKNLVLLEHMFNSFRRHFHVLILKKDMCFWRFLI